MKKNNYIKAYTILEAIFSMLLLSIIVGLTYLLFNLISKQMSILKKENTMELNYLFFDSNFHEDLSNSIDHKFKKSEITLKYYDKSEISYNFNKKFILRTKENNTDTIPLKIKSFRFLAYNNSINLLEIDILLLNESLKNNYFLYKDLSQIINKKYFNEN
jgi:competence protein ComGF